MRFMFSSTRGAGHLQPLLPYARALQARGHAVVVAAPTEVGEAIRQAGLAHAPFDHPGDEVLAPVWARLRDASPAEGLPIALREIFAGPNAQAALPKLQQAIQTFRPDLLVRDSLEFAALIAAQRAGLPHARVAVHMVSFEDFVPDTVAEPLAALRAASGLAPDHGAALRLEPCFSAFPASLDSAPTAGPRTPEVFRARTLEQTSSQVPATPWRPDATDPRPLVYITFGTLVGSLPHVRDIYRVALSAVAALPVRAVLTTGPSLDPELLGTIPSNVQVAAWIPQGDVLAHAAAVVCHGGSGTVLGTLAFGLPLVVIPVGADQPHNAQRIAEVGAGLSLPEPDLASLRTAIERVLVDPDLQAGAKKMAADIAALPSLDDAVDALVALANAS